MRPRYLAALVFLIFIVSLLIYCVVVGWIRAGREINDSKSGDDDEA
jgi:hypothetical protein